ncbi:acyl-CoA dehydrogenase family protein, partial [Sphingomonas sp.]|uniref:acyl-CoA dehydrogenase family protein n=1 Tax=Sphingomonas sp. TaxID=28214 RepID=UPI002585011F
MLMAVEGLMRGGTTGVTVGLGSLGIALPAIVQGGDAAQIDRYVRPTLAGETIAALAITEPGTGSDVASVRTRAVRDGDHYVVNGAKMFITSGVRADFITTLVRSGDDPHGGLSFLVIEKDMPGVSFGANERKLGWHSQPTAQVIFEDVRIPVDNRVGGEGEGFRIAMMGLDGGRLNIGACSLGGAQRCLDEAIAYTRERKQFGTAIADFQNTQFTLADMATDL